MQIPNNQAKTILLIDDEEVLRESISDFLEDRDYRVLTAENGNRGIEVFLAEKADLILTDLRMPGMDGLELLQKIGEISPETPLIVVSGTGRIADTVQALRYGAWDYILKPVQDMDIIIHAIEKSLERADLQRQNKLYQEKLESLVNQRTTELKKANSHLATINSRLKRVLQTTKNLSVCTGVLKFGSTLLSEFANHMEATGGSLFLRESDGLRLINSLDADHVPSFLSFPLTEGSVFQKVMDSKQPLLSQNIHQDKMISKSGWDGYQDGSMLVFPLLGDLGEIVGLLTLHNKVSPPFIEQDLEIGTILASYSCETLRAIYATENLRASESRFRDLAEMLPEAIFEMDLNFTISYVNLRAVQLFGYTEQEFLDNFNALDLITAKQRKLAHINIVQQGESSRENSFEYSATRKNGEEFPILNHTALIKENHLAVGYRGIMVDLSDMKRADQEKSNLEKQYHQAQKVESVGRLAGGVAHDLNNLLTPVLGYGQLLMQDFQSGDKRKGYLKQMMKASEGARDLVGQLLAFSRKQTLEYRPLNINDVIKGFQELLRRTIREDIELIYRFSSDIKTVEADIGQIEQVVMNLAVNAADAMPKGGHLTFETTTSVADFEGKSEEWVVLTVIDTGCGMVKETLNHIFEPFYSTKGDKGTGLGLATVYGIVTQHRGHAQVESKPDKGTCFKIYLPTVEGGGSSQQPEQLIRVDNYEGTEKILLVEDNDQVKEMVDLLLGQLGYTVFSANAGPEALDILASNKVDLLLTDVILPGMNGKQLFLKAQELQPTIQVLYISGYADGIIGEDGVLGNRVAFVQKPFTIETLAVKIRKVLAEKTERQDIVE